MQCSEYSLRRGLCTLLIIWYSNQNDYYVYMSLLSARGMCVSFVVWLNLFEN